MKKIFFCLLIFIIIVIIGIKVNYKSNIILYFGNNKNDYNYFYNDTRIKDILIDIDNNIKIKDKYIQNILVKANYIYIDLNNLVLNYNSINEIEKLFNKIRLFSKEKIIVILSNNNEVLAKSINNRIFKIKDKYDIIIKR